MRVTFWGVLLPFALCTLQALLSTSHNTEPLGKPVAVLSVLWLVMGILIAAVYWLVRLVKGVWTRDTR
jgi:hypothetical protein